MKFIRQGGKKGAAPTGGGAAQSGRLTARERDGRTSQLVSETGGRMRMLTGTEGAIEFMCWQVTPVVEVFGRWRKSDSPMVCMATPKRKEG